MNRNKELEIKPSTYSVHVKIECESTCVFGLRSISPSKNRICFTYYISVRHIIVLLENTKFELSNKTM